MTLTKVFFALIALALFLPLASALPISQCGMINEPGTYELTRNLFSPTYTCLIINSSNVSFNGQGYTISSDYPQHHGLLRYGIRTAPYRTYENIRVENVSVQGFNAAGILLQGVSNASVDSVSIALSARGIELGNIHQSRVSNVFITDVYHSGSAFRLIYSSGNMFENIYVTNMRGPGVLIGQSNDNLFDTFVINSKYGQVGIDLTSGVNNTFVDGSVSLAGFYPAIRISQSNDTRIERSSFEGAGEALQFSDSHGLVLDESVLSSGESFFDVRGNGFNPGSLILKDTSVRSFRFDHNLSRLVVENSNHGQISLGNVSGSGSSLALLPDAVLRSESMSFTLMPELNWEGGARLVFYGEPDGQGRLVVLRNGVNCGVDCWENPIFETDTFVVDVYRDGFYELVRRPGRP